MQIKVITGVFLTGLHSKSELALKDAYGLRRCGWHLELGFEVVELVLQGHLFFLLLFLFPGVADNGN